MLKYKLAAFASLIIILFSTVMVLLVLRVSQRNNVEKSSKNILFSVQLLADKSNAIFDTVRKGAVLFSFNEGIYILVNRNASEYSYEKIRSLKESITTYITYIGLNDFVSSIYLYDTRTTEAISVIYGMSQTIPLFENMTQEQIDRIRNMWISTTQIQALPQRDIRRESAFYYRVYSDNGEDYAAIVITMSEDKIASLYNELSVAQGASIYLTDPEGVIISCDDKNLLGGSIHAILGGVADIGGTDHSDIYAIDGIRQLVAVAKIPVNGWRYVLVVPERELIAEGAQTVTVTALLIGCIAVLTAISIVWFFSRFFAAPLESLMADVKAYNDRDKHDRTHAVSFNRKDEIGYLAQTVFGTLDENNALNRRLYQQRVMLMEADIRILYAQINPHFLYNSLDAITWLAEFNENEKVIAMLGKLSTYYRTSLGSGHETTTLREEKTMLESYFEIQQLRYADRLHYRISFRENTLDCVIARHLLQPIVENAVTHCVEKSSRPTHVEIQSLKVDDKLKLAVSDDGPGIAADKLTDILQVMRAPENKNGGYSAFRNIYKRILLLYGQEYGVDIDTQPGRGTTVTLWLPFIREGD